MDVTTDNVERELVDFYGLPESARSDFDYVDCEDDRYSARFVEYRGSWYDVHEFQAVSGNAWAGSMASDLPGWDGYQTDSYFSAVVMRWVPDTDYEAVVMGLALS